MVAWTCKRLLVQILGLAASANAAGLALVPHTLDANLGACGACGTIHY